MHESSRHKSSDSHGRAGARAPALLEWLVALVGLVLLCASVGYLTYQAVAAKPGSPDPVVEVVAVEAQGTRFLVRVRVSNRASEPAAALKVAGLLTRDGRLIERRETELDYLPGKSWREGGLFFSRDPAGFELEIRPESYRTP